MIDGLSPADHVAALVRTIDRQHGPSVQEPAFSTLLVIGAAAEPSAVAAIRAIGGGAPLATDEGFTVEFRR
jgi:hypothetical protein